MLYVQCCMLYLCSVYSCINYTKPKRVPLWQFSISVKLKINCLILFLARSLLPIQSLFICHHNMITHGLECFCTSNHHLVRRRTLAGLQTNMKNWFGWMRNCVSTKFSLRILHQNVTQRITKSMILVQQGVRLRPIRNGRFLHKKKKEKVREEEKESENKAHE